MQLTVAICTYRRHALLRQTLASLAQCDSIDAAWELLVVDNADESAVAEIVAEFADRLPVRHIAEPTTGTSHARNRAVAEAKAPIILFTDDDVTFEPDWLTKMWRAIEAQPGCAFWGGRVEPQWSIDRPKWFAPQHCPMLTDTIVQYDRGEQSRAWRLDDDPPFYTANLALRTEAIRAAGGFDTRLGHRGDKRMGMEDSLMVRAIAGAGRAGWYVADAVVHHPVPADRMKKKYARAFAWRQGWTSVEILRDASLREASVSSVSDAKALSDAKPQTAGPSKKNRPPRWLYKVAFLGVFKGLGRWLGGLICLDPGRAFAGQFVAVNNLSKLWHAIRAK